jgi:hypothetical protein
MTWRIQKLFTLAAIAAALLINSLPARPGPMAPKAAPNPKYCLDELIQVVISRNAA